MDIQVAAAGPDAFDALEALVAAFHREDGIDLPADQRRAAVEELLRDQALGEAYFISDGERTLGYAILGFGFSMEMGGRDAFLDELYLAPAHRGRGVGKAALEALIAVAEARGVRAIHLEVDAGNDRATRLYEGAGFERRGRYQLMSRRAGP